MRNSKITSININEVQGENYKWITLTVNIKELEQKLWNITYYSSFAFQCPKNYNELTEDKIIALLDLNKSYIENLLKKEFAPWFDLKLSKLFGKYYIGENKFDN